MTFKNPLAYSLDRECSCSTVVWMYPMVLTGAERREKKKWVDPKTSWTRFLPDFKYIKYIPYPHLVKPEVLPVVQCIIVALCGLWWKRFTNISYRTYSYGRDMNLVVDSQYVCMWSIFWRFQLLIIFLILI